MTKRIVFAAFIILIVAWVVLASIRTFAYLKTLLFTDLRNANANTLIDNDALDMKLLARKLNESDGDLFVYSTSSGRKFFLLRYYAYPKKVYWYQENKYPRNPELNFISD